MKRIIVYAVLVLAAAALGLGTFSCASAPSGAEGEGLVKVWEVPGNWINAQSLGEELALTEMKGLKPYGLVVNARTGQPDEQATAAYNESLEKSVKPGSQPSIFNDIEFLGKSGKQGISFSRNQKKIKATSSDGELYSIDLLDANIFFDLFDEEGFFISIGKSGHYAIHDILSGKQRNAGFLDLSKGPAIKQFKLDVTQDGGLFCVVRDGADLSVFLIDPTGALTHSIPLKLRIERLPAGESAYVTGPFVYGDLAYIGSGGLSCIDLIQGRELWTKNLNVKKGEGLAALGMLSGGAAGAIMMESAGFAMIPVKPLMLDDERLVVFDMNGETYCLNRKTGEEIWKAKSNNKIDAVDFSGNDILVKYGITTVTVNGPRNEGPFGFRILNAKDGTQVLDFPVKEPLLGMNVAEQNAFLFGAKSVYVIDIAGRKSAAQVEFAKTHKTGNAFEYQAVPDSSDVLLYTGSSILKFDVEQRKISFASKLGLPSIRNANGSFYEDAVIVTSLDNRNGLFFSTMNLSSGEVFYTVPIGYNIKGYVTYGFSLMPEYNLFTVNTKKGKPSLPDLDAVTAYKIIP